MVKKELTQVEIAESIPDLWQPLTETQREYLAKNFTIQKYKKNETIYCEGETPMHLMCLLSGKVKIYKDGVGGRSQIIRVIKDKEYFAYRAYFAQENFVTAAAAFEPCTICLVPMPVISELIKENTDLAMFFIKQLSIDLGKLDSKAHSRTSGRVFAVPERYLWSRRRSVYAEHIPLARRLGELVEHDNIERYSYFIEFRDRETYHYRRTKN